MLGRVFGIICVIAFLFAAATGNMQNMSNAVIDGAAGAVRLTISLTGIMCLWCGVMQVFGDAGVIKKLSRPLSPILRLFFPTACRTGRGAEEITANISANLLGIGNAATPLAIEAMRKMQEDNPDPASASADMITLAVLNTASVSVLPSTLIALRRAAGSAQPYAIVLPVWICSFSCAFIALMLTRAAAVVCESGARRRAAAFAKAGQPVGNAGLRAGKVSPGVADSGGIGVTGGRGSSGRKTSAVKTGGEDSRRGTADRSGA